MASSSAHCGLVSSSSQVRLTLVVASFEQSWAPRDLPAHSSWAASMPPGSRADRPRPQVSDLATRPLRRALAVCDRRAFYALAARRPPHQTRGATCRYRAHAERPVLGGR
jgi:hypothetical protein